MQKGNPSKKIRKAQKQNRPGSESDMEPRPVYDDKRIKGSGKLKGKVALVTGGDSGIGRAVAIRFAKEGADVAIAYRSEHKDAKDTAKLVEAYGRKCLLIAADISKENNCTKVVSNTVKEFGRIDVLVNNAAVQYEEENLEKISTKHLLETFSVNFFALLWITKKALRYMAKGSCIINTTSVTAYRGSAHLMDYAATKGAILSFTRSLASNLADKGIRVNAVAPGPIWTPLIVSSFKPSKVASFGSETPLKRAGEPVEVASCYMFLASDDASYITGQVLHPNGGEIING